MQLIPRYLVNNRIDIVANEAGFVTEYKPVYQRNITLYKGIDNNVQFRLLNADQKPINTTLYTPMLVMFDENNNMILERECTVQDDGSSATKGLFVATIGDNDLLNLKQQYLKYNIYLVDINSEKVLTYTNEHFGACGVAYLDGSCFPGPRSTYEVSTFTEDRGLFDDPNDSVWYSESVTAQPAINGNEALHTAAFYTNNFTGTVTIQATLDNQVTDNTDWADVTSLTFSGTEVEPKPINFNGVFSYLRFKTETNPDQTITKILVRN